MLLRHGIVQSIASRHFIHTFEAKRVVNIDGSLGLRYSTAVGQGHLLAYRVKPARGEADIAVRR